MKKLLKRLSVIVIAVVMVATSTIIVGAQAIDKSNMAKGQVVDVVHYSRLTDTYEHGTVTMDTNRVGASPNYFIIARNSFVKTKGLVSSETKKKIQSIKKYTEMVFVEREGKYQPQKFGYIDSEAYPYPEYVSIAPYVYQHFDEVGIDMSENVWLAIGDYQGKYVDDVYLTVSEADGSVLVKVVTPKGMSIRLENGSVLSSGDTFNATIGKTYKFQMCSNNWDNDIYDDVGNGIAGTVVYSVKVSESNTDRGYDPVTKTFTLPKGDKTLRTDVNNCFMAYKYHFSKGDYNKQTGIVNVVNTPLESLSVNLPLGSTIKSDAYKKMNQIDTANVFIEQAGDKSLSYTDYYWNY